MGSQWEEPYRTGRHLMAFRQSLKVKDTGIEFDLTLSGDCKPAVIHDDTLERTARGQDGAFHHAYEQLREMDAGSWLDPRFSGERLPSLYDVWEELCQRVYPFFGCFDALRPRVSRTS